MRRFLICALVIPTVGLAACGENGEGDGVRSDSDQAAKLQEKRQAAEVAREKARQAAKAEREKTLKRRYRRALRVALIPLEGKSRKEQLRIADAVDRLAQIAKEEVDVVAPLLQALRKRHYERITKLRYFYVRLGKPGSEAVLIQTLYRAGPTPAGTGLALTYLESGNKKLIKATRKSASREGFKISGSPSSAVGTQWGCLGVYRAGRKTSSASPPIIGQEC